MPPLTKRQCARLGGLAVLKKYGVEHLRAIGRRGAATFWKRYSFKPVNQSQFAIVRRVNGEVVAFLDGRPF